MGPKVFIHESKGRLQPCNFFLLGFLKERVYHPLPTNLVALKIKIKSEFERIPEVMVMRSIMDMKMMGGLMVEFEGDQFEGRSI